MKIEKAKQKDAIVLSELTIRSKSYWNYSEKQIELWKEDLTVSEQYILDKKVYTLTNNSIIIGYYSYFSINETEVKLENLFVDSEFIGKGFGKLLMADFLQRIENSKFKKISLDADPNAENFYTQYGFKVIGKIKTSIKNRFLPIMEMKINSL